MVGMAALVLLLNGFVSLALYHISALPRFGGHQENRVNAQAASPAPAVQEAMVTQEVPEKSPLIVITGDAGTIVGQMARIPAENEQVTEIKSPSEVDKETGRELLSIIGKY